MVWNEIDWNALIPAALTAGVAYLAARWAWSKLPKRDVGAAALTSVQAAEAAVNLTLRTTEDRIEALEERVRVLEDLVIEKEEKIKHLLAEIKLLERWIAVLLELLNKNGIEPITLDEIRTLDGGEAHEFSGY